MRRRIGTFLTFVILLLGCSLSSPEKVFAALYINEFLSDTNGSNDDPDWIEIYNGGPDTIELSLYRIRDNTSSNKLDLSGTISSGELKAFDWTNKLNKSGDIIKLLLSSDELIVDQVSYGDQGGDIIAPIKSQSAGRKTDGAGEWVIFLSNSKGSSNNSSSLAPTATPTFTPTPIHTPTPTKVPTPTKTPIPTKTPTPTKIPTPTKTPTPPPKLTEKEPLPNYQKQPLSLRLANSKPVDNQSTRAATIPQVGVLGEKASQGSTPTPTIMKEKEIKTLGASSGGLAIVLITSGMFFMGACGILLFRSWRKRLAIG